MILADRGSLPFSYLASMHIFSQEQHYTQVCCIMLFSGTWSSPSFSGTRPSPCAGFSLTSIDDHQALVYGGVDGEHHCCVSDLYLIDFQLMVCELCIQP